MDVDSDAPGVGVRGWFARALSEAGTLILPVQCAGCGRADVALCPQCRAGLIPAAANRPLPGGLSVASGLVFEGPTARVLRALKESGRIGLARELSPALAVAAQAAGYQSGMVAVPIPTSRASFRRRGYRVAELLGRRAGLRTVRVLSPGRRVRDQRGLSAADRERNVAGAFRVRRSISPTRIIIIDDVLTTGATLGEAARVLTLAGFDVVGLAVVAATPRRSRK